MSGKCYHHYLDCLLQHRKLTGLMCAEVGGFNSFEPLVAGARANLPVLDADGMGRAFPELPVLFCDIV